MTVFWNDGALRRIPREFRGPRHGIIDISVKTTFSIPRRVQFAETDMAGIAHFANYFRWMEEVEHAFFRSVGLSVSMQHDGLHIGWPRVAVACEFFAPVRFEDEIELRLRVTKVGEKSFNYEVDFVVGDRRAALGKLTSVCCTLDTAGGPMRSIPIPAALRERLKAQSSEEDESTSKSPV